VTLALCTLGHSLPIAPCKTNESTFNVFYFSKLDTGYQSLCTIIAKINFYIYVCACVRVGVGVSKDYTSYFNLVIFFGIGALLINSVLGSRDS
jgi:hypothetical protein